MLSCAMYTMLSLNVSAGVAPIQVYLTPPSALGISSCGGGAVSVPTTLYVRNAPSQAGTQTTCALISMTYQVNSQTFNLLYPQKFYFSPNHQSNQVISVDLIPQFQGYGTIDSTDAVTINVQSCPDGSPNFLGYLDIVGYGVEAPTAVEHANLP